MVCLLAISKLKLFEVIPILYTLPVLLPLGSCLKINFMHKNCGYTVDPLSSQAPLYCPGTHKIEGVFQFRESSLIMRGLHCVLTSYRTACNTAAIPM